MESSIHITHALNWICHLCAIIRCRVNFNAIWIYAYCIHQNTMHVCVFRCNVCRVRYWTRRWNAVMFGADIYQLTNNGKFIAFVIALSPNALVCVVGLFRIEIRLVYCPFAVHWWPQRMNLSVSALIECILCVRTFFGSFRVRHFPLTWTFSHQHWCHQMKIIRFDFEIQFWTCKKKKFKLINTYL